MRYTYTAAWTVAGGITLQDDSPPIELASSENTMFILTRDPDPLLEKVDEAFAVGRLMLKSLMGQLGSREFDAALSLEIEEIKAERKKKMGSQPVLLFQAHGEIDATLKKPSQECDTFIVTFDAIEKGRVRELLQTEIEAMKVAVALENENPSRFACLSDETYLLNDTGKPIYSISFSMGSDVSVSTPVSNEAVARIGFRYNALKKRNDLNSVERLFSQMADHGTDRLKTFLSGWAALEILIAKSFKRYEQEFFSPFTNADQQTLRERFLARIKSVMKDKYRIMDRFVAVTAVLFPNIEDVEAEKDYADFCKLKEIRDSIYHGEPFLEKDLPVHEMAMLLRKYLIAQIAAPTSRFSRRGATRR